jgi:hypothetical protein
VQNDSIVQSEVVRELTPDDWSKAVLEEVLFRAASKISQPDAATDRVTVELEFSITPDLIGRRLTIATPGAVERAIITHLTL